MHDLLLAACVCGAEPDFGPTVARLRRLAASEAALPPDDPWLDRRAVLLSASAVLILRLATMLDRAREVARRAAGAAVGDRPRRPLRNATPTSVESGWRRWFPSPSILTRAA
jgi:hypothetical protein